MLKRKLVLTIAILVAVSFVLSPLMRADAIVVLSNRPWSGVGNGYCSDNNITVGVRFTVPTGDAYVLNSVTALLGASIVNPQAQFTLNDDAFGTTQPGNVIVTLGTQTLSGTSSEYTFPGGGNLLMPGTSYWIVLSVLDSTICPGYWSEGTTPAGIFTYSTAVQVINGTPVTRPPLDVEIDADTAGEDLVAYAVCSGDDLEINTNGGDLPMDVYANGAYVGTADALGQWYITGPGAFNDVTLMELSGDMENLNLGSFNCPSYGVPNLGLVKINATAGIQPYGMPGMEMQNFVLPADYDGNGYDTYTVTEVTMVGDEYWLGLFIGSGDWVYVPYSAVIPLTPIAGIN